MRRAPGAREPGQAENHPEERRRHAGCKTVYRLRHDQDSSARRGASCLFGSDLPKRSHRPEAQPAPGPAHRQARHWYRARAINQEGRLPADGGRAGCARPIRRGACSRRVRSRIRRRVPNARCRRRLEVPAHPAIVVATEWGEWRRSIDEDLRSAGWISAAAPGRVDVEDV
jgi:hypothetical protein